MPRQHKHNHGSIYFRFDFPLTSQGVFFDNLTIDGYGCIEHGQPQADIDSIEYRGVEVKPLLEIMGGMQQVDAAATDHVRGLFETTQIQERELMTA